MDQIRTYMCTKPETPEINGLDGAQKGTYKVRRVLCTMFWWAWQLSVKSFPNFRELYGAINDSGWHRMTLDCH